MKTHPPAFVAAHALLAARCSAISYDSQRVAQEDLAKLGLTNVRFFDNPSSDTQGFVAANEAVCILAFRGTKEPRDFLTDADFRFITVKGQRIHAGFYNALDSVIIDVIEAVRAVCTKGQVIVVTGHSLGGALALLFSALTRVHSCYTFGQPRVGDKAFADACEIALGETHFRIVNKADIVARSAGPIWPAYRHSGRMLLFEPNGKMEWEPAWWQRLVGDIKLIARAFKRGKLALLDDHCVVKYCSLIGRLNN